MSLPAGRQVARGEVKIKLTKGELKRQRDALKQYQRYLPTLQLKKQQLQIEILHQLDLLREKKRLEAVKRESASSWTGLLTDGFNLKKYVLPEAVSTDTKNIAGVDVRVFREARFADPDYDLFLAPLWVDAGVDCWKNINSLRLEVRLIEEAVKILRDELRVTTQRVNLFEKVKIPEAEEAIHLIKIYIGDQMSNAVGRSKIAKRKIGEAELAGVSI